MPTGYWPKGQSELFGIMRQDLLTRIPKINASIITCFSETFLPFQIQQNKMQDMVLSLPLFLCSSAYSQHLHYNIPPSSTFNTIYAPPLGGPMGSLLLLFLIISLCWTLKSLLHQGGPMGIQQYSAERTLPRGWFIFFSSQRKMKKIHWLWKLVRV